MVVNAKSNKHQGRNQGTSSDFVEDHNLIGSSEMVDGLFLKVDTNQQLSNQR